jgi:hypothetical protein
LTTTLKNFQRMWAEYPLGTSDEVKKRIGGAVDADWVTNTCVVRVSRSFNYAGFPIPIKQHGLSTLKGGDGKRYGFRVAELKIYLRAAHGAPAVTHSYPGEGGPPPDAIAGKQGVICFDVSGWSDATGHFDLWDGERCVNHGYFDRASKVHLWTVGDDDVQQTGPAQAPVVIAQTLSGSVGKGGKNDPADVRLVQTLLAAAGLDPGPIDGDAGPATIEAIKAFQKRFATWPDGRVDPGGRTFRELHKL